MVENFTQVNSYQDKLLEAMSIVSSQLISSIPYDKTITCTIINDEEKEKGKYKVTNGDATFDAYSSDTKLKKEDVVYVTIPEGNYENQKIIQGKKTSNNEKPFVFTTPEDTILDLTDNLINKKTLPNYKLETMPVGLKANKVDGDQKLITKNIFTISDLEKEKFIGYTRLLLKADFQSWIPEAISGDYGLKVTITDNLNTTTKDDHTVDNVIQTKVMLLNCSDMYGNPYNFENFYEQQIVFDISDLNTITSISVDFYQLGESFYDINKELLPFFETISQIDGTEQQVDLPNDLFVTNLYIGLGYDVSEITDELIIPVINDSMTYSEYRNNEDNKKEIDLRWVHQFEDDPKVVEPESDFQGENARLKDCEIRWYRYRLGAAAADEYCGVYWTKLYVKKQEDKYLLSSEPLEEGAIEEKQALENVIFSPDISYQTEQIKIIIYLNGIAIRGPVITFENEQSTTGKDVENFLNALEIECVDGTLGNYLIYNEAGNILNTADSQEERKLICNFANTGDLAKSNLLLDSSKGDEISWKIPIQNSMIKLQGYEIKGEEKELRYYPSYPANDINGNQINYEEKPEYYVVAINDDTQPVYTQGNYVIIQGAAAFWNNTILYPTYKISSLYSMYNMNNTIACTIRKDRVIYTTEKEFTFGVSGTMGSDKSLVVDFVGGHTAIMKNSGEAYSLQVKMYDENNKPVDLNGVRIKWSWFAPGGEVISSAVSFNGASQIEVFESVVDLKINNSLLSLSDPNQIYIAKVVVGEEGAELETYFPIPIKSSEEYSHIDGATSVIYLSNGEPDYYKGDYKLFKTVDNTIGTPGVEIITEDVTWDVIYPIIDDGVDNTVDIKTYIAQVNASGEKGLRPISVYTQGIQNYAVIAKVNSTVVWKQPILVLRNKYPSRVINKWDGKTLTIDNEMGIILNSAIASGRKEDDNTFTGVMLGDWTKQKSPTDKSLSQHTGVYGFHQGAMCYAFMDNGTAFLGKDGEGRIDFNGNTGKIYSQTGAGMEIDLDDGLIISKKLSLRAGFESTSSTDYIILDTTKTTKLPIGNTSPTNHGQYPFEIGKYFKADYLGNIYAASGKIGAWKFLPADGTTGLNTTGTEVLESLPDNVSAGSLYSGIIPSQYSSIILDPVKNEVTGGKFKASILEALQGTIKLGGYIKVYDHEVKVPIGYENQGDIDYTGYGENKDKVGGGTLGFMTANFGGETESTEIDDTTGLPKTVKKAGIGMSYSGGGTVKATSENAGLSYKNYYISLQEGKSVMRGNTARLILQETPEYDKNNNVTSQPHAGLGYKNQYITCNSDGDVVIAASSKILLQSGNTYLSGNLYIGESDENDPSKMKKTFLSGEVKIGESKENLKANAIISGNLSVGKDEEGLTATTTLNGKLTVNTGGAKISGGTTLSGVAASEGVSAVLGLQVSNGAKIDYLGVNTSVDTNYRIKVSGNIAAGIGYMQLGSNSDSARNPAYVSSLNASSSVTFDPEKPQKGIKAQFA